MHHSETPSIKGEQVTERPSDAMAAAKRSSGSLLRQKFQRLIDPPKSKLEEFYGQPRNKLDIFPSQISEKITSLDIVEVGKKVGKIIWSREDVQPFMAYMNPTTRKINFSNIRQNYERDRFKKHFLYMMGRIKDEKKPKMMDFGSIENKLKASPLPTENIDSRVIYVWKAHNFLCKERTTFGMRRVEEGECHIYQIIGGKLTLYQERGQNKICK